MKEESTFVVFANGIAEVKANQPFLVQVVNFSNATVTLQKNERIGQAIRVPIPSDPTSMIE